MRKKHYSKRSDLEKIESNWNKIRGLLGRKEWSGAVVRAATATEIAANLAVREELVDARELEPGFVDSLLKWANGLMGKLDRLLLPLAERAHRRRLDEVKTMAQLISAERNTVVHSGAFKNGATARRVVGDARKVIHALVDFYYDDFELEEVE